MNYTDLGTRFGLMLASCCIWTTETRTEWSSDTVLDYPALLKPKLFLVPGCEVVLVGKRIQVTHPRVVQAITQHSGGQVVAAGWPQRENGVAFVLEWI